MSPISENLFGKIQKLEQKVSDFLRYAIYGQRFLEHFFLTIFAVIIIIIFFWTGNFKYIIFIHEFRLKLSGNALKNLRFLAKSSWKNILEKSRVLCQNFFSKYRNFRLRCHWKNQQYYNFFWKIQEQEQRTQDPCREFSSGILLLSLKIYDFRPENL